MKKTVILEDEVKNNNEQTIAKMQVYLTGDGSTPNVLTMGGMPIGYHDDGSPIIPKSSNELIENAQQNFMAEAIKEQKKLCVENGVDPDLVNILNAEKKVGTNNEQSTN